MVGGAQGNLLVAKGLLRSTRGAKGDIELRDESLFFPAPVRSEERAVLLDGRSGSFFQVALFRVSVGSE